MQSHERVKLLESFYSSIYLHEKHDGPDRSRINAGRRLVGALKQGIPGNKILNIGSGPQSTEKELFFPRVGKERQFLEAYNFYTIDIAQIRRFRLLGEIYGVEHTRGNALQLPYPQDNFGLILACFSLDLLPSAAFSETERVLLANGKAILFFHHPDMIPEDLSRIRDPRIRKYWAYLKEEDILFRDGDQIRNFLQNYRLESKEIALASDRTDKWWEVEAVKM